MTRYWGITPSGITAPSVDMIASYTLADISGVEGSISGAHLDGTFNQTTNPWTKLAALAGNLSTGIRPLTNGQLSVFTGITLAPPTVSIDNGAAVSVCEGSTVALTSTVGGIPTITYSWSPTTDLNSAIIPNPIFTGNTPGGPTPYALTITDGNGITVSDIINMTVIAAPTADAGTATAETCEDTSYTVAGASATNSSGILWTHNGSGTFT
ncbi:MAG: hypothetical protein HC811_02100, partial [Flammeovirgaceae bacterium]|nr:hypothetical protein [Flammeovirgaceae bacterium]